MLPVGIERGAFAGHETFPFRTMWLRKAVESTERDTRVFRRDDAMVELGVGKNMVRSIRHWGLATGMIHKDPTVHDNRGRELCPTVLGEALMADDGWDPFLEDPGTLWLLHWQLASKPSPGTTWYWTFNHAPQLEFNKQELLGWLSKLVAQQGWSRVAESSLKRDIDCFLRTYVPTKPSKKIPLEDTLDCPLVELGLIREFSTKGNHVIVRGEHASLPDAVFTHALCVFIERSELTSKTIPIDSISFKPGSPGRVFCLSEEALLRRLERLDEATDGLMVFDETAGLRQVLIHDMPDEDDLLHHYYSRDDYAEAEEDV